ncbi:MAG: hypothetical protein ACU0CA_05760 [Paracoccaceae bacterium]
MSEKKKKFEADLKRLVSMGNMLSMAMRYDCFGDIFKDQVSSDLGEGKVDEYLEKLPNFKTDYQTWYSEAHAVVRQILPDRLKDFESYFEYTRVRKEITFQNYMIRDYLQGLQITSGYEKHVIAEGKAAIPEFDQQLNIIKAAQNTLNSSLMDMTAMLQADLFDTEVDSAQALAKAGFLRAAGAICGVVIEKHLKQVCDAHNVTIRKKNPGISDLNEELKKKNILTVAQWRFNQHLGDLRNLCDHAKGKEPTKEEIDDLVAGTGKVLKTVF